jgi:M-phase inducer tyrosine phosphatase
MEASSPLASMQASSFNASCGSQADTLVSFASGSMLVPPSFNFKDLSMMRKTKTKTKTDADYFSSKPMRGSSPTASLAADLSQNFHIDQRYF